MERESFVFYSSFLKAIRAIKKRDIQAELALAIIEYGITGETTECGEVVSVAMELIKPQIEANNQRYINGKKGAEHGIKGGRPKKENPTETPPKPLKNPTETPNVNVNDNVNDNISFLEKKKQKNDVAVSDLENENSESPIETIQTPKEQSGGGRKRFTVPTPEEVQMYCDERKNGISGQQFCDFYSSKGWRVGSQPMKDWKAAVRTWEVRRKDTAPSITQSQAQISPPKRIRFDEYGNEIVY
jgi:hypothetical protein|nr:MAG TPA: hypothetical protein [Caudoviricetes sp.]